MYKIDMWYTVKTLIERGKSLRSISKELGISRKTITKIRDEIQDGIIKPPEINKGLILDDYHDYIFELVEKQLTSILIHRKLVEKKGLTVSYSTVLRYVNNLKQSEVYVPVELPPGEESQVDFGYLGLFKKGGKLIKVWIFCMLLSYSRHAYYEIVTNQTTHTFIRCHIYAFEFFRGVTKTVKIDNLKAAVLKANFYEPVMQEQYSQFLSHYGSAPITARIRRGQDKGKVESGIKYVKNNFLKGLGHRDYYKAIKDLKLWNNQVCNKRVHGTTRKVPEGVYIQREQKELIRLPGRRYEIFKVEQRKVKPNMHISFLLNYYSVPYQYTNKEVVVKSNENIIRVYDGLEQIATHPIEKVQTGIYITIEEHKPPYKQKKSDEFYFLRAKQTGNYVYQYIKELKQNKPHCWKRMINGVFNLVNHYNEGIVNMACKRALDYQVYSYQSVKNICQKGLYIKHSENLSIKIISGFKHDLSVYDKLSNLN